MPSEIDGRLLVDASGSVVEISGQYVSVDISGQSVVTDISGQTVIANISGQIVTADVSGQPVVVDISGQTVIAVISGEIAADISGDVVRITTLSGTEEFHAIITSGIVISLISGQSVETSISGQTVDISGQAVITSVSGQYVFAEISGASVTIGDVYRKLHSSTTTLLSSTGIYMSTPENAFRFGYIHGTVFADKLGTLYIDESPDGTNWDASFKINVGANTGARFNTTIDGEHVRIRYENGNQAQTVFRLYSWLRVL